jgi:hypothetical protein
MGQFDSIASLKKYVKETDMRQPYTIKKLEDGGMMARGGKTSRYNEGLSWHQDHARFNKSEKYEKPLKRRRKY